MCGVWSPKYPKLAQRASQSIMGAALNGISNVLTTISGSVVIFDMSSTHFNNIIFKNTHRYRDKIISSFSKDSTLSLPSGRNPAPSAVYQRNAHNSYKASLVKSSHWEEIMSEFYSLSTKGITNIEQPKSASTIPIVIGPVRVCCHHTNQLFIKNPSRAGNLEGKYSILSLKKSKKNPELRAKPSLGILKICSRKSLIFQNCLPLPVHINYNIIYDPHIYTMSRKYIIDNAMQTKLAKATVFIKAQGMISNDLCGQNIYRWSSDLILNMRLRYIFSGITLIFHLSDATDVLHMVATYQIDSANREIYFFREGSAVFWNVSEIERKNVLRFLKKYERGKYDKEIVDEESESLSYTFSETSVKTKLVKDRIILNTEGQTDMEKYTFSNALAQSVKLGIWEANLDKYIDNIEFVSEELRKKGRVVLSQEKVLQRMGQLFALRHLVNLSSDLLDVPDFYWDHPELELLYKKTCNHLSITQRTTVMNEKINHCLELMELLKSSLSEAHAARLEWIIIILIMVEVGFELFHVIEK
ncbi:unnamed protein product, partial [Meganyctiphanes norvegica]